MFRSPKPERVADQLAREAAEKAAAERRRHAANRIAALERADGLQRDRLANCHGRHIADKINLDADYLLFVVRGTAIAITRPASRTRRTDRLMVGAVSPVYQIAMRLQAVAGIGIDSPRILQGRRLSHDARDVPIAAVDPDDRELRALIAPPPRGTRP